MNQATTEVVEGQIYKHYKGNKYVVVGVGHHSENGEHLVFYKRIGNAEGSHVWARPYTMFTDNVTLDAYQGTREVPRFKLTSSVHN